MPQDRESDLPIIAHGYRVILRDWLASDVDNPQACFVGIDICEDAYLNRGLGTEALQLWVDYITTP
jgi:RimJ/RimL family protein N-acetyltransferase